jgi:hypothetical protein
MLNKLKWITGIIGILFIASCLFVNYTDKEFLKTGVLRIKEKPDSMKILNYSMHSSLDGNECDEYEVSIENNQFSRLLAGRKYNLAKDPQAILELWGLDPYRKTFQVEQCYTSGNLSTGWVNIFVNKEKKRAYIVYMVN